MDKYITDERTGLNYELIGDYYLIAGDEEPEHELFCIWQQRLPEQPRIICCAIRSLSMSVAPPERNHVFPLKAITFP